MHECENCQATFAPNPYDPSENLTGQCPNCGHPYAGHLPNPIHDEMTHGLDAMPTSTMDDMSGNPLQEGTLGYGDGGYQNRQKRDESYASVQDRYADRRYAFGDEDSDDFSLGGQLPVQEGDEYNVQVPTHAFLISPSGKVHAMQDMPDNHMTHEQIAQTLGDPEEVLRHSALGRLYSNGQTSWHGNGSRLTPQMLQQLASDHFGRQVTVDPNDPGVYTPTQEERFDLNSFRDDDPLGDQRAIRSRPANPLDKEWAIRGGSWDPLERFSADFEAEDMDVVPPGGQTVEATPHPSGFHGGTITPLKSIKGLLVNGRPLDDSYAQELGSWDPSQNVMLSHDDPQLLDVAKQVIETGGSGPLIQHAMATQAGHRGQVQLPNGLTNNVHQTLGNLGAWVGNPQEANELRPWKNSAYRNLIRDYHDQNRPPVTHIGVRDPAMLKVIQDVANSDDLQPLYDYHGIPRQGKLAFLPALAIGAEALGGAEIGGLLRSAVPSLMGGALGRGLTGNGSQPQAPMPLPSGEMGEDFHSAHQRLTFDKAEHPSSQDEVGNSDDPEKVDQHEVNDGDMTPGQDFKNDNQGGGADTPGMQALQGALPFVIEMALSPESGQGHPLLEAIHQMLESETPGYLNTPGDEGAAHKLIALVQGHGGKDEESAEKKEANTFPPQGMGVPNPGSVPNPAQQFNTPMPTPGNHGKCPICGSTYDPSHPTCPQCGAGTIAQPGQMGTVEQDIGGMQVGAAVDDHSFMYEQSPEDIPPGVSLDEYRRQQPAKPNQVFGPCPNCHAATDLAQPFCKMCLQDLPRLAKTAVTHQGPHTPEQQQAVAQVLLDQGRQDEIPVMLDPMTAYQYAGELAQIQGQEAPPQGEAQDPAPPPGEQPQPGMMPVPPMSAPPLGMQAALERYAADSAAPSCPKCDSHTTGVLTNDGTCRCHSCGDVWKADGLSINDAPDGKTGRWQITAIDHQQDLNVNPSDAPAADAEKPFDPEMDQDPSHTWQDLNGQPLVVGRQYKIHSQKYSIPDVVQIVAVKPDSIQVQETGAYGLGYSREIHHEEAQLDGLEFEGIGDFSDADPTQPEQPEAPDLEVGPGDQTDMSVDHSQGHGLRANVKQAELHGWDKPPAQSSCLACGGLYGAHERECPMDDAWESQQQQRALEQSWRAPTVEHPLGPTAKVASEYGYTCPQCHHSDDTQGGPLPSACPSCGISGYTMWNDDPDLQHYLNPQGHEAPIQNMQQNSLQQQFNLPSAEHPLGPQTGKTAGAKFTPMEQSEFVNEQGMARNADKLDLSNTHYESSTYDLEDDFLFGL